MRKKLRDWHKDIHAVKSKNKKQLLINIHELELVPESCTLDEYELSKL
jgi:hypothetical protein